MKLSAEQFSKQTATQPLAPCYWLTGDEVLQRQECHDQLLQRAKQNGFDERERLELTSGDSSMLHAALYARSLFSNKRVIEINLSQGKINETLAELLLKFCQKPNPDVLLLIQSPKLESGVTQNRAYKAFDAMGVVIQSWPIPLNQLPKFFAARLAQHGLSTSLSGLQLLSELTEGNLLYAAQSVEKLALFYTGTQNPLTHEQIIEVVAPQAYFDTFQLNEAFLLGEKIRALHICRSLCATDHEIIMVWGALMKDIRLLCKMEQLSKKRSFAECCTALGVWEQRKHLYRSGLQHVRCGTPLLKAMAAIDRLVKNPKAGNPWLALERLIITRLR